MNAQQVRVVGADATGRTRRSPNLHGPHDHGPKRHRASVLVAALVCASTLVLSPTTAQASPDTALSSTQVNSRVETGLRPLLQDAVAAGLPGVIARVQDGSETKLVAAGVADVATGAALRPHARFRVGSITKTFVATVVLQLVGEGRLSLDEPVGRRLPGLLANGDTITVRQLLNHTSGLFNYTDDPTLLPGLAQNRVFTPRELVAIAETHPSTAPPGTKWAYSNTNYVVAGLLVEAVTGHRVGQELRTRIFEPLGLEDTSFPVTSGKIAGYHAHGYVPSGLIPTGAVGTEFPPTPDGRLVDVTELNPSAAWAAGAIISNAPDLSRFYQALMTGKLLTPSMLREMKTTVPTDPTNPSGPGYGLGILRLPTPCGDNWGHDGAWPGYQDVALWNERTDRTVVIAWTLYDQPAAAGVALSNLTGFALCGMPPLRR
jgi:D-alanyl-D-alanine carboxypeptidase